VGRLPYPSAARSRPDPSITAPAAFAIGFPYGLAFSTRTKTLIAATQSRFITPVANSTSISNLADSILAGRADDRLKWQGEETVRVLMTKIFPRDSGYMQTITGRRQRLRTALQTLLADAGWREIRRDVYSKA
jgi:hypothetical protein